MEEGLDVGRRKLRKGSSEAAMSVPIVCSCVNATEGKNVQRLEMCNVWKYLLFNGFFGLSANQSAPLSQIARNPQHSP